MDTTLKISLGSVYVPGNADTAIQAVPEGALDVMLTGSMLQTETDKIARNRS
ncbi:hypothetical protein [Ammoniphilus sp. 3BR4]|uniref:hypothetical protein n=1 Tax=Ammoniphilus sp. 3BR4 TaxID=3158265 RepID=UPI0034654755